MTRSPPKPKMTIVFSIPRKRGVEASASDGAANS